MSKIIKSSYVIIQNPKSVKDGAKITKPIYTATSDSDLILSEAYSEKEEILNDALEEAKAIINSANEYKNSMLITVTAEIEKQNKMGFDIGHKEGYENGMKLGQIEGKKLAEHEANVKSEGLIAELCKQIFAVEESKDEILHKFEKDLVKLSVDIAEKIIRTKISEDEDIIKNIISNAIKDYKNSEWVKVYLSSNDYITISTDQNIMRRLSQISEHVRLEVVTDANDGDLIIETPENLIDSGVNTQLNNLRDTVLGA